MAASISPEYQRHVNALIVVSDIYPEIMKTMVADTWPPLLVKKLLSGNLGRRFVHTLTAKQQNIVHSINTDGYRLFDVDLMYKIIRHFDLVDEPQRGWGQRPGPNDSNQGDDIERMRYHKNNIVHRPRLSLTERTFEEFFSDSINIAKRIDSTLKSTFQNRIEDVKKFTPVTSDEGNQYLEMTAKYHGSTSLNNARTLQLYIKEEIKSKMDDKNNDNMQCVLYVRDPVMTDSSAIVKMLEEVKHQINDGTCEIKLISIEEGSLIIHATLSKILTKMEFLFTELTLLFNCIFKFDYIDKNCGRQIDVTLAESDYIIIEDQSASAEVEAVTKKMLIMNIEVPKSSFQNEQIFWNDMCSFLKNLSRVLFINPFIGNELPMDVAITEDHEEEVSSIAPLNIKQKERENFFRTSTLLVDHSKESFTGLLDHHLRNQNLNLLKFIQLKQHEIYHMCYHKKCCMCSSRSFGSISNRMRILTTAQLDILLDISTKLHGHNPVSSKGKYCCCPANPKINYDKLDLTLTGCLLINLNIISPGSPESKAVEKLIKIRNKSFGHAASGLISDQDYHTYIAKIGKYIMVLATVQGREAEFKQKLCDAASRPLDETILRQYQTTLIEYQITLMKNEKLTKTVKNMACGYGVRSLPGCISKDLCDETTTEGCDAHFKICTKQDGLQSVWAKDGMEIKNCHKYKIEKNGRIHSLDIINTCLADKGVYSFRLNDIQRQAHLYVEEYFTKNLQTMECIEGETVEFICEVVVDESLPARWTRDDRNNRIPLETDDKYQIQQAGKIHCLRVLNCIPLDSGDYTVNINNRVRNTSLMVIEYFKKNLETMECEEGETAEFLCEVIEDRVHSRWIKNDGHNDILLKTDDKYQILQVGKFHRLSIRNCNLQDSGDYTVNINNRVRTASLRVTEGEIVPLESEIHGDDQIAIFGTEVTTSPKHNSCRHDKRLRHIVIRTKNYNDEEDKTLCCARIATCCTKAKRRRKRIGLENED